MKEGLEPDPTSSCGGVCSICRGVPRLDPNAFITTESITIGMLLRETGQPDVRTALFKLKELLQATKGG